MITLKTTLGDIVIELNHEKAPITAKNFEEYVKSGFYKGTIFHRVIKGFMIQGGGLNSQLEQKKTNAPIKNEADNGLKNDRGTIAMARTNDPHSATAQFFINTVDNSFLNFRSKDLSGWGYCVFGKVVEGMDVVDKIEKAKTTTVSYYQDVPVETIEILDATVED
ncbi:MAG: peptidylprolyl isomerase [Succinivibrio sp.]|nr:peptidylprolyl isomerase [Succinivibrio sp.]MCI7785851.1 peptidylprolyl isomerase [Succinivibrio sp.]